MIKFENTEVMGWEAAIRGMRNPMNSWEKSDSYELGVDPVKEDIPHVKSTYHIGRNDLNLMKRLRNAGTDHRKFMRMITVYVDITAPLYWWKEFDTYKVGTVANSCSTMHKIAAKEFTLDDFSTDHLLDEKDYYEILNTPDDFPKFDGKDGKELFWTSIDILKTTIFGLNFYRKRYLKTKEKKYWWQMIQLLPSNYNQKRTVMMNYEVLANIYKSRKNHKLDEWAEHEISQVTYYTDVGIVKSIENPLPFGYFGFCDWIKTLPYSELITDSGKPQLEAVSLSKEDISKLNDIAGWLKSFGEDESSALLYHIQKELNKIITKS